MGSDAKKLHRGIVSGFELSLPQHFRVEAVPKVLIGMIIIFPKSISDAWVLVWLHLLRGRDTDLTRRWTEGKPWEIAWGELRWEGTDGSDDWVDGGETVGNSMGRVLWGRIEMEGTREWTRGNCGK